MSIWERSAGNPRDILSDRTVPNGGRPMDYQQSSAQKETDPNKIVSQGLQDLKQVFIEQDIAPYMVDSWMMRRVVVREDEAPESLVVILRGKSIDEAKSCILMARGRTVSIGTNGHEPTWEDANFFRVKVEEFRNQEG